VNGLAPDNDDLAVTGNPARCADDMFELSTIHKWSGARSRSNATKWT
jgi:hypothetical protein